MDSLATLPPPVTGERYDDTPVSLGAYNALLRRHDTLAGVLRQVERERDTAERLVAGYQDRIATGQLRGKSRYWRYGFFGAGGVFVGWLLGGLV